MEADDCEGRLLRFLELSLALISYRSDFLPQRCGYLARAKLTTLYL